MLRSNFNSLATPDVGDCGICYETVPCLKVLDCEHCLCLACAASIARSEAETDQQTVSGQLTISCPECRRTTNRRQTAGVNALKTRYFGKVKCDLCLEKKCVDDMWWCDQCVRTVCSKCNVKDHSKKQHRISEWNKLEPVKMACRKSVETERNRRIVKCFLNAVEQQLEQQLGSQPELQQLQSGLYDRYGAQFAQTPTATAVDQRGDRSAIDDRRFDDGARTVAKVMQLSGVDVLEASVPSIHDQNFQLHFSTTPDEVARYLCTKIDFIPDERPREISPSKSDLSLPLDKPRSVDSPSTNASRPFVELQQVKFPINKDAVIDFQYDRGDLVAFLHATAGATVINSETGKAVTSSSVTNSRICRSVAFSETVGILYMAMQSKQKPYEWTLDAVNVGKSPSDLLFSTAFGIDPEDRVESMALSVSPRDPGVIYQLRVCSNNVSEIWRATVERKRSSKVKLKETLVYQCAAVLSSLNVSPLLNGKEYALLAWDEKSRALCRLIVREGRCHLSTRILSCADPSPYCLDAVGHLWLFDPCTNALCVSNAPILNRAPVILRRIGKYTDVQLQRLWLNRWNVVVGVHVLDDGKTLQFVECCTEKPPTTPDGMGVKPNPMKRRSISCV